MAVVTHIGTLPDSSNKTDFYAIIDNATVTGIVNADISSSAGIVDTKLAQITTAAKVSGTAITGALASSVLAATQTEGDNSTKIATTAYADGKISKTIAGEINAMTEKTTPINADLVVVEDSANSYAKRKVQIGNIRPTKASLGIDSGTSPELGSGTTYQDVTFNFTFVSAPIIVATPNMSIGGDTGWWVSNKTTTGFRMNHYNVSTSGTTYNWIAIGTPA